MSIFTADDVSAADKVVLGEIHKSVLAQFRDRTDAGPVSEVIAEALLELHSAGQRDPEALERYAGYRARLFMIKPWQS